MKKKILSFVFIFAILPSLVFAQVIDTSSISRLKNGQIQFVKGALSVSLLDTVSESYSLSEMERLGFKVQSHNIERNSIMITNSPPDSTLNRFSTFPGVFDLQQESSSIDLDKYVNNIVAQQGITDSAEIKKLYDRLSTISQEGPTYVRFNFEIQRKDIPRIMRSFRNIAYKIVPISPRSLVIAMEEGKEEKTIQDLEKLSFVTGTAYIGYLE